MAKSILQSQLDNLDWLESTGSQQFKRLNLKGIDVVLEKRMRLFEQEFRNNITKYNVNSSGNMQDSLEYDIVDNADEKILNIYFAPYAKFVDKGVRGWGSSRNAPDSPYTFHNPAKKSSNGAFRKSITESIRSGRLKSRASDVKKYGAIGQERKSKDKKTPLDRKVDTAMFLIRKYGIKKTNFLTKAIDKSFKGLEKEIADELSDEILLTIIL